MARRKTFRKCVLKEMSNGRTRKDASIKCSTKNTKNGKTKHEN